MKFKYLTVLLIFFSCSTHYTKFENRKSYNSKGFAKIQIGISKGRKKEDKREYKKEQDWKREKGRLIAKQFK